MSVSSREIGTLIVVVLKARNLPNKKHIGKQAPYCLVVHNDKKRRTKVIKRGGQHPEWDDEFRFTIYEDMESETPTSAHQGSNILPPLPPKRSKGTKKIIGGSFMKLQCYADDAREPDFIGETLVDLTEALTKGETDEWFTLTHKDKYAGEVYLELTFWSNEPRPEKKIPRQSMPSYGGPGSFQPTDGSPQSAKYVPGAERAELNSLPSTLRSSAVPPELYAPCYERKSQVPPSRIDYLTEDFAELGVMDGRRRESYPPTGGTIYPLATGAPIMPPPLPSPHGDIPIYSSEFPGHSAYHHHPQAPPSFVPQLPHAPHAGHHLAPGPLAVPATTLGTLPQPEYAYSSEHVSFPALEYPNDVPRGHFAGTTQLPLHLTTRELPHPPTLTPSRPLPQPGQSQRDRCKSVSGSFSGFSTRPPLPQPPVDPSVFAHVPLSIPLPFPRAPQPPLADGSLHRAHSSRLTGSGIF